MNKMKNRGGIKKAGKIEAVAIILNLVVGLLAGVFLVGLVSGLDDGVPDIDHNVHAQPDPPEVRDPVVSSVVYDDTGLIVTDNTNRYGLGPKPPITESDGTGPVVADDITPQSGKWAGEGIVQRLVTGPPGTLGQGLTQGLAWAGIAQLVVPMIGDLLGLEEGLTGGLTDAVSAGMFAFRTMSGAIKGGMIGNGQSFLGMSPGLWGIGIGVLVFLLTYKKTEYKTITFTCQPWEAPIGGDDCEKCNDALHACTEYRCKSLGQACELIEENIGSGQEICVNKHRGNVNSPAIRPWQEILTDDYKYTKIGLRPLSTGTEIVRGSDGKCIEEFTPIEFGIQTDMPAQCRITDDISLGYDEIEDYFGGSTLYAYNHSQKLSLPGPDTVDDFVEANTEEGEEGGITIYNEGEYELFVRCRSPNGFYNRDAYVIEFCIDDGPQFTPPIIEEFSIEDGSPVPYQIDEYEIIAYVNEPAECKWSRTNIIYAEMEHEMDCATNPNQMNEDMYYECIDTLTGIKDNGEVNEYYFNCKNQPWLSDGALRMTMTTNQLFTLIGTQELLIDESSIKPVSGGEPLTGGSSVIEVNLELITQLGNKDGEAECRFRSSLDEGWAPFLETSNFAEEDSLTNQHKQRQDLPAGTYIYYFGCIDKGGNYANASTTFDVYVDKTAPKVVRILYDTSGSQNNYLKIITDEDALCSYTTDNDVKCDYDLNEDTVTSMHRTEGEETKEHFVDWDTSLVYYIKCTDGNVVPRSGVCSAIVQAVDI